MIRACTVVRIHSAIPYCKSIGLSVIRSTDCDPEPFNTQTDHSIDPFQCGILVKSSSTTVSSQTPTLGMYKSCVDLNKCYQWLPWLSKRHSTQCKCMYRSEIGYVDDLSSTEKHNLFANLLSVPKDNNPTSKVKIINISSCVALSRLQRLSLIVSLLLKTS